MINYFSFSRLILKYIVMSAMFWWYPGHILNYIDAVTIKYVSYLSFVSYSFSFVYINNKVNLCSLKKVWHLSIPLICKKRFFLIPPVKKYIFT